MNSMEKVPFREKGWEACLSPVYQMFSPLTICNLFDFCSISLSQRLSCKPVLIGIIAFPSWVMLVSSCRSSLSMLSEVTGGISLVQQPDTLKNTLRNQTKGSKKEVICTYSSLSGA